MKVQEKVMIHFKKQWTSYLVTTVVTGALLLGVRNNSHPDGLPDQLTPIVTIGSVMPAAASSAGMDAGGDASGNSTDTYWIMRIHDGTPTWAQVDVAMVAIPAGTVEPSEQAAITATTTPTPTSGAGVGTATPSPLQATRTPTASSTPWPTPTKVTSMPTATRTPIPLADACGAPEHYPCIVDSNGIEYLVTATVNIRSEPKSSGGAATIVGQRKPGDRVIFECLFHVSVSELWGSAQPCGAVAGTWSAITYAASSYMVQTP
jgi:hypothetical protein